MKKVLLVAIAAWGTSQMCQAATMIVGSGAGAQYAEIQMAIDAAGDEDTVRVQAGEYVITDAITFAGKAITLIADSGPGETMIRAAEEAENPPGMLVHFDGAESENAVLEGFTISNSEGYGVFCGEGASPTLRGCLITGSANSGVYCDVGSSPTLEGCTITGNTGSGLRCARDSAPTLIDCTISRNFAYRGGGVYADRASLFLSGCTISNNCCRPRGGGGGLYLDSSVAVLENCTIVGNLSTQRGGGLFCVSSSPTLTGCTIAGNLASAGSGMYAEDASSPTVTSSIVWGNAGDSLASEDVSSIDVTYSCVEGDTIRGGAGNINADPLFCGWESAEVAVSDQRGLEDALDFRYTLSSQSPCLGTGEGGANMGAATGVCDTQGTPQRLVRLAAGTYSVTPINLWERVSLQGAVHKGTGQNEPSQNETVLEGTVRGLRTDASLSSLTVDGQIEIEPGEGPEIADSTITGDGVRCGEGSSPSFRGCTIRDNSWAGVECSMGSSPSFVHCTITANEGPGIRGYEATPLIESSIIWNNRRGSLDLDFEDEGSPTVRYSCVEGETVHPGEGNIDSDPLFCGWESAEVSVADDAALEEALDPLAFRLSLAAGSPCLASAADGTNMGAESGVCEGPPRPLRIVRLAPGLYGGSSLDLAPGVSIEGAGEENTILEGRVSGLRTGASLSNVTVDGRITIASGEGPEIVDSTITRGVRCREESFPTLRGCTIRGGGTGVDCDMGSSPSLVHCTITGNRGPAIGGYEARPLIESSIIWDNAGGSFDLDFEDEGSPTVRYSCVEGETVHPGEGNINADPLFCGWESAEVSVEDDAALEEALDPLAFRLSLAAGSPCLASAGDGTNMGADTGTCEELPEPRQLVRLGPGTYASGGLDLTHGVSIEGAGEEHTILEGGVRGLRTGASLASLTVSGSGIQIGPGQAPEVRDCRILSAEVNCAENSSPTLRDCTITGSSWAGVSCEMGSSPNLVHCTLAGNEGPGIYGYGARPVIESSIIWDNVGGSFELQPEREVNDPLFRPGGGATVRYSCVEGPTPAGAGNINADPLFCGWESADVSVEDEAGLEEALDPAAFRVSLAPDSPCLASAADGTNMGADRGACDDPVGEQRLVRLAAGSYSAYLLKLAHGVRIEGAGQKDTILEGTVDNLRTRTSLANLTVNGNIYIGPGQAPEIMDCVIQSGRWGVVCQEDSSPTLRGCTIAATLGDGVYCDSRSSLTLIHCTITGNGGAGIAGGSVTAVRLENSIVWDNGGGSFDLQRSPIPSVRYSCVEGPGAPGGVGNIYSDPLFCGWDSSEVSVEDDVGLREALDPAAFDLSLAPDSPCLGSAEGGVDMGAAGGLCDRPVEPHRLVRLAPGTYSIYDVNLSHRVSLEGAGAEATTLEGTVESLRTGASLAGCTVREGGIAIGAGQSPEIRDCVITSSYQGVSGGRDSSPTVTRCIITGVHADGMSFSTGASPTIVHCTITGNQGFGIAGNAAHPLIENSLVWNNLQGSHRFVSGASVTVRYSCMETAVVYPGEGNINADPRFCGWESAEVLVDRDGGLEDALDPLAFRLSLAQDSPCLGAAQGGANMGADTGLCPADAVVGRRRIRLAAGTYGFGSIESLYPFSLEGSGEDETTIQGGLSNLFTGTVVSDLTIAGSVRIEGEAPLLERVTITDGGSGVSCHVGAAPTLVDCTISGNTAERGGALFCVGSSPILRRCTLRGNSARAGGGAVYASGTSVVTLIDCAVVGNATPGSTDGGALLLEQGASVTLEGCVLSANAAGDDGGAVACKAGTLRLINCLITGNLAMGQGGGIYSRRESNVSLTNCTVSGNVAQEGGGGLYGAARAAPVITNSIVWDNTPQSIEVAAGGAPQVSYTCTEQAFSWPGPGNIARDPLFERPGVFDVTRMEIAPSEVELPDFVIDAGDYRLQSGSPAIDAGTAENAPVTDIEGGERFCGASVDLGAFENCDGPVDLLRGDCNGDGVVGATVDDAVLLLDFNFLGERVPPCLAACDANGNGVVLGTVEDAIHILNFSFVGGPPPAAPFPECGPGTESDGVLGCATPPANCQ